MAGSHSDSRGLALASQVVSGLKAHFGRAARNFEIRDVQEDQNLIAFSIGFDVYDYFVMSFSYDRGFFGFGIDYGARGVSVLSDKDVTGSLDEMNSIAAELDRRLRLRIPDKYLDVYSPPEMP
ncbi:hypothetical protein [Pseudolysinimonas sp.]|jgi:hypothetical protein|uniref:hypothetical protein n=1 Tax=Pseudolysinimonas sp. TaxID=2680009 RepID=UPI003783E2D2